MTQHSTTSARREVPLPEAPRSLHNRGRAQPKGPSVGVATRVSMSDPFAVPSQRSSQPHAKAAARFRAHTDCGKPRPAWHPAHGGRPRNASGEDPICNSKTKGSRKHAGRETPAPHTFVWGSLNIPRSKNCARHKGSELGTAVKDGLNAGTPIIPSNRRNYAPGR